MILYLAIWSEMGIKRDSLEDIDKDVYMNHTYLKKFKTFGYKYNSEHEYQYLLEKNGICENEYYINEQGDFVPGIIEP